uniref:Uncharacterized protein n=1 Tax=Entomoneis paludosa TaxID=265537 RepID=A0A7S2VF22_9STRA
MASDDPTLLSDKFEFLTPFKGPIRKNEFLQSCAMEEFEGVNPSFSHFRVDPYDPVRVWVDVLPSGNGYQGCPQAMSFAFDEEGFCDRITSSFVMDPSIGNGGGLGGPEGYKYATGQASLDILTRPWARVVGRARKQVLAPLTGVGVDDYVTPEQVKAKESAPSGSLSIESVQQSGMLQSKPVENLSELRASSEISVPKAPQLPTTPPPPAVVEKQSEIIERQAKATEEEARLKRQGADEAKLLIAEVEEAEKRALEARIKLAKLEAERAESERRLKEAQAQRAARMVELEQEKIAAAEARQAKQDQLRNKAEQTSKAVAQSPPMNSVANPVESAAEKARALLAEVNAKRAAKLETDRAAAEKRAKEMEKKRKSQAEEKQKKQEVERALLAKKKAESDAKRAAAAEAKRKQAEKLKADIEKKTAMKRAQSLMSSQKTAQNLKAQTAEKRRKQEAQRAEMLRKKQEAQRERVATAAAAANKKKLGTAPARSAEKKKGTIRSKTGEGSDDVKEAELKAKRIQDAEAAKERQRAALEALQNAVSRATVSLFGLAGGQPKANEEEEKQSPFAAQAKTPSGAPKGVPVLKRWRKTKDGAITGMVYGSSSFSDGDRVTTSPIAFGKVSKGEVVKTGSGSKYYLS